MALYMKYRHEAFQEEVIYYHCITLAMLVYCIRVCVCVCLMHMVIPCVFQSATSCCI